MAESSERSAEKQKRVRPLLSCTQCHARKIKCDRVKPCGACCLRGTPDQCSLETSDDAQSYISQANEIKRLRKLVADLELRLSRDAGTSESTGPVSILPARPRPSTEAAPSGSNFPFHQLRHLCANLSPTSISWAEQPFIPIHALSNIQMAPPSLSHLSSKAQVENTMLSHFLDCISPQSLSGVRSWFRAVADVSSQSDLLGPAVQGISNLFFALQTNDHALLRESQGRHVMALAKLRQEIAEPSINTGYFALYSTMLLVFYELASFNSPFSWIVHLGGAEKIVKHLGPSAFSRGLPHDTFVLFSFFSFILRIFQRKRSFLAEPAWRNEPYPDAASHSDPFIRLLVLITNIPLILEQAEIVYSNIDVSEDNPRNPPQLVVRLWDRIGAMEAELQRWESETVRSHEGSPAESTSSVDIRMSSPGDSSGRTLEPATTLCVYYSARLLLAHVDRRPSASPDARARPQSSHQRSPAGRRGGSASSGGDSPGSATSPATPAQVLRWAVSICHVARDRAPHVRDAVTAVVYLFTLRVAYFSFPELSNGRKWIEGLFDSVAARFGLPLARSILTHLPGPEGPALQDLAG